MHWRTYQHNSHVKRYKPIKLVVLFQVAFLSGGGWVGVFYFFSFLKGKKEKDEILSYLI